MATASTRALPLPAGAPAPRMDPLSALLSSATPDDPHFTDALNEAIREAPAGTREEAAALAERLLAMLESGRLEVLRGTGDEPAAVVAAARVLELGFPWALHLSPEQLARVRAMKKPSPARPRGAAFVCSAVSTGMTLTCLLTSERQWPPPPSAFWSTFYALALVFMLALNGAFSLGRAPRWITAGLSAALLVFCWLVADWLPLPGSGDLCRLAGMAPFFWLALGASLLPRRQR